jgi:hypothetical protein
VARGRIVRPDFQRWHSTGRTKARGKPTKTRSVHQAAWCRLSVGFPGGRVVIASIGSRGIFHKIAYANLNMNDISYRYVLNIPYLLLNEHRPRLSRPDKAIACWRTPHTSHVAQRASVSNPPRPETRPVGRPCVGGFSLGWVRPARGRRVLDRRMIDTPHGEWWRQANGMVGRAREEAKTAASPTPHRNKTAKLSQKRLDDNSPSVWAK